MCTSLFKTPSVPKTPPAPVAPSAEDDAARMRRANAAAASAQAQGRAATITTAPLGDSSYGSSLGGARLSGF